jgi:hypothetical protein
MPRRAGCSQTTCSRVLCCWPEPPNPPLDVSSERCNDNTGFPSTATLTRLPKHCNNDNASRCGAGSTSRTAPHRMRAPRRPAVPPALAALPSASPVKRHCLHISPARVFHTRQWQQRQGVPTAASLRRHRSACARLLGAGGAVALEAVEVRGGAGAMAPCMPGSAADGALGSALQAHPGPQHTPPVPSLARRRWRPQFRRRRPQLWRRRPGLWRAWRRWAWLGARGAARW